MALARRFLLLSSVLLSPLVACPPQDNAASPSAGTGAEAPTAARVEPAPAAPAQPEVTPEPAPAAAALLPAGEPQKKLEAAEDRHFKANPERRLYIQLDKPLYQPGETVWVRSVAVQAAGLDWAQRDDAFAFQLINPKGAVAQAKLVKAAGGAAGADFDLDPSIEGGEYTLQVLGHGLTEKRTFIVNAYEAPRFKKTLEFVKKAYGPGDEVAATVEVKRPTGEAFAQKSLTGVLTLDGAELPRVKVRSDEKGACVIKVKLPAGIQKGDGLLTVLVEDSGITESITKRVPIVLHKLKLSFFPEGGDLVSGLPSRVYFYAQNMLDKPADIEGKVVDDHDQTMATFSSLHDGMGRFAFTPATGRSYHVEVTRPTGIIEPFSLPVAAEAGCTLKTFDDPKGIEKAIRAAVHCTEPRTVVLNAVVRGQRAATATAKVEPGKPTVAYLELARPEAQGVARVTLFSDSLEPLAERLVYRAWHKDLKVTVKPNRKSYSPRGQVTLEIETRDLSGKPVAAELAMSAVDDTVLSYADDKNAHLLAHLLLEGEVPNKVEEPNYYFKEDKADAPLALEMLLGTRGWRRFEWQRVLNPPPPLEVASGIRPFATKGGGLRGGVGALNRDGRDEGDELEFHKVFGAPAFRRAPARPQPAMAFPKGEAKPAAAPAPAVAQALAPAAPADKKGQALRIAPMAPPQPAPIGRAIAREEPRKKIALDERRRRLADDDVIEGGVIAGINDLEEVEAVPAPTAWAKVRVFPVPIYPATYDGPRTDFRQTLYWNPSVKTDASGKAKVTFPVSDAITSFRVTTEGISAAAGLAGRDETILESKLPFFMEVKLPLEVSAGDLMNLPLTLRNEQPSGLRIAVETRFGSQVKLLENVAPGEVALSGAAGTTLSYPLQVVGKSGSAEVSFAAKAQGLRDEFTRTLKVVPLGFPRTEAFSGTLEKTASKVLWLKGALDGTLQAKATFYPSPLASMLTGLESILQEPSGCFEQASSSNYPNVMVMQYLQEHDVAEPAILDRASRLLDSGYKKIAAYESSTRGYEWFGGNPGHESLTAYGLMEFADMRPVYGSVSAEMIKRTTAWLYGRRDGKGGFQRNPQALDSFGAASPEVTNAYIVFALAETGAKDIGPELNAVTALAKSSSDPYLVALATRAQLDVSPGGAEGAALAKKLAGLQRPDGSFHGTTHSITRSGGQGLDVETTSLSILALLSAKGYDESVRSAVKWLASSRSSWGGYRSTQATILALKALTAYDKASRRMPAGGEITLLVNGAEVSKLRFEKGRKDPIVVDEIGRHFKEGENKVELKLESTAALPFTIGVDYRTNDPAASPFVPLRLTTSSAKESVKMGETVRVVAKLESTSAQGLPMALARIGIPGGLASQTWQLKELVDKKTIDFFETREREVIVYFRALPPKAVKEIALDLVANVPGTYTAPASSAYLYYTAEEKAWASPIRMRVDRT